MDNYVNIVGYQLEKVHTGVIKWALDSFGGISNVQIAIFEQLFRVGGQVIPFAKKDVLRCICTPEYSFGRKIRIDLMIEVETLQGSYHLICEMKVDSDPYPEQLNQIVSMVESDSYLSKSIGRYYFLVLIGASTVMRQVGDSHSSFNVLTNRDLIDAFSIIKRPTYILSDWLGALSQEIDREESIEENYKEISNKNLWKKNNHIDFGYRPYFSTFYYLYNKMRRFSSKPDKWKIYSGRNNPVMNLSGQWEKVGDFTFYWEFNYLEFCLKVQIDKSKVSRDKLNSLRKAIVPFCEGIACGGHKSQRRYGEWNSIYKWSFDPILQSYDEIFRIIEERILPTYISILNAASTH